MNSAIILAGGNGIRMGLDIPKQFIIIRHQMIIDYSVKVFLKNKNINDVIIVCTENWIHKIKTKYSNVKVVKGGATRIESSFIGLKTCNPKTENVLIHDSARPLIDQNIINECIKNLKEHDAAIPVLNCDDSIINVTEMNYIRRNDVKIIQTPQAFKYKKIYQAYKNSDTSFSDDFSLLINYNKATNYIFINGYKKNIKITKSEDLLLAGRYLNEE